MNKFFLRVGFFFMKNMSYNRMTKMAKKRGMQMTKSQYTMMKNMSFEEYLRSLSLVNSAKSKMPQVIVPCDIDFAKELESSATLRQVAGNTHIGVSADFIDSELLDDRVLPLITDNFNSFTFTNSMKWQASLVDGNNNYRQYDFSKIDEVLSQLNSAGIRVRGHNMLWGKFVGMTFPLSVKTEVDNSKDKVGTLKAIIDTRITDVLTHFRGKVAQWDVINETIPYTSEFTFDGYFYEIMGEEYIEYIFRKAHEVDSSVELYLNEAIGDFSGDKGKQYIQWLSGMIAKGVPIDGIGIQGHITRGSWDIAGMDWFATQLEQLGVKFEITELDMSVAPLLDNSNPLESQGQYIYNLVSTALSHSNCTGVTLWGFSDNASWYDGTSPFNMHSPNKPNIFDNNYNKKPMYYAVRKALQEANHKGAK